MEVKINDAILLWNHGGDLIVTDEKRVGNHGGFLMSDGAVFLRFEEFSKKEKLTEIFQILLTAIIRDKVSISSVRKAIKENKFLEENFPLDL